MQWLETLVIVSHVVVAVALVGIILMQRGKGADMGAAFGGGASQTVFGSQGSGNFLTKMTTILGILFFITSITLAVFATQRAEVAELQGIPSVEQPESSAPQGSSSETDNDVQGTPDSDNPSENERSDDSQSDADAQDNALPELQ